MNGKTTILVPIRYPLTADSMRTLAFANTLPERYEGAELCILHVNLFQNGDRTQRDEIVHAIAPLFDKCTPNVIVRSGLLIEDTIVEEARIAGADIVVLGKSQKPVWRRVLSKLVGNSPAVEHHLREHTAATVEVAE